MESAMERANDYITWIAISLIALYVGAAGIAKLAGVPYVHSSFPKLGLPAWFGYFIGVCEVLGPIGLFIRPLSAIAAVGIGIIMIGATYYHAAYTPAIQAVPAFVLGILCACVFWRRRADIFKFDKKRLQIFSYLAVVVFLAVQTVPALAQTSATDSQSKAREDLAGIQAAAERFVRALDNLDWEAFRASWTSEPTVFLPFADTPDRVTGQVAVEARWRRFFEEARARRPGPPYLNLKPLDMRTERYGDVGLVTFTLQLTTEGRKLPLQRRTLVFVRQHDAWKLAHLHASGATQP
jgi:putative oxidoreductase